MSKESSNLMMASVKHHIVPILKGYLIKNMVIFFIFLLIFVPLTLHNSPPIREHDPTDEMYLYDHHPFAEDLDSDLWDYDYVGIEFEEESPEDPEEDEGPQLEGVLTIGSIIMASVLLIVLGLNLAIVHVLLFSGPMNHGYARAVTRLGIKAGSMLKSRMYAVLMVFSLVSIFDLLIASAMAYMIAGWFWGVFIAGVATIIVFVMLYAMAFGLQTVVRFRHRKRPMYPMIAFAFVFCLLAIPSQSIFNGIIEIVDDMIGIGTTGGGGTILMYLSPFHLLGEIFDWAIYGTSVNIFSFIWVPIVAVLIYVGLRSLGGLDYDKIHYAPGQNRMRY